MTGKKLILLVRLKYSSIVESVGPEKVDVLERIKGRLQHKGLFKYHMMLREGVWPNRHITFIAGLAIKKPT